MQFEGCCQRAPEGVTPDQLVSVWVHRGLDDDLLDEGHRLGVRPSGPVVGPGVVVAPDLGVSAVHRDGQQRVTRPQDPDKREHQHNHGLQTEKMETDINIVLRVFQSKGTSLCINIIECQ